MKYIKNKFFLALILFLLSPVANIYPINSKYSSIFTLKANVSGNNVFINCYKDENTNFFVFLPSTISNEQYSFYNINGQNLRINGKKINVGDSIRDFELNKKYSIEYDSNNSTIVFLKSKNLPSIFISIGRNSLDNIKKSKTFRDSGTFNLIENTGKLTNSNLFWIHAHGTSSFQLFDKKSFTIKFERKHELLGMEASDKWVLLANVTDDTSGIRNYIAYNMAIYAGLDYACELRFVDLYVNNEYYGMYQLVEKAGIGHERLDIGSRETNKINRACLLERNYGYKVFDASTNFITNEGDTFCLEDPKILTKKQLNYVKNIVQNVENTLFSSNYRDKNNKKLEDLIDLESWSIRYLVDEVTKNEGAGATSSFFYTKENKSVLYSGPAWDYDKCIGLLFYGYDLYAWKDTDGLFFGSMHQVAPTLWWNKFYNYPKAQKLIKEKYRYLIKPYLKNLLDKDLDKIKDYIIESYNMNYIRWKKEQNSYLKYAGQLKDAVEYIRKWIVQRELFLDKVWIENIKQYTVLVKESYTTHHYYYLFDGDKLSNYVDKNYKYYNLFTKEEYDIDNEIHDNLYLSTNKDINFIFLNIPNKDIVNVGYKKIFLYVVLIVMFIIVIIKSIIG